MEDQLLDTWRISNRINLYILDAISLDLLDSVSTSKGRNVGAQFAHMHNVRLMWLDAAGPELMEGLSKIEKDDTSNRELLKQSLEGSGTAVEKLLKKGMEAGGKIKGFKPHVVAFLGYLMSHDAYHRGEIGIILKQVGHPLDDKISYGMWEWGVR